MSSTPVTLYSADRKVPPPTPVTFEEFMEWADEDSRSEWVDGEIIVMAPSNLGHQDLLGFLYKLLDDFVRAHRLGRVFLAGVLMRLATRPSGREPDVLFVANAHLDRLRETYLDGPADLVVEIVSPDSVERDRVEKLGEYEAAGIPEYWVIDLPRKEALFYQLREDGRYRLVLPDDRGVYHSSVLEGFRLKVSWVWQSPLPDAREVASQLGA
ncbi:MAG: Uma2 family endonuclease [Chloroflexota bacterium]|nr:Uma2 family endonuclease [Chloroflexota bacterium]